MNFPLSDSSFSDFLPLYAHLPPPPQEIASSRISKPRSPSKKPSPPKVFVCSSPNCGKRFSKKWNLQAHERLHTGSTPFVCRLGCGEAYMWMSSRKGHELNRCKYALKKKNQSKSTSQSIDVQPATSSSDLSSSLSSSLNSLTYFTTTSENYSLQSIMFDDRDLASDNKESDPTSSLVVFEETSDCLSNVTEDVLDKEETSKGETTMAMDADLVLADVPLPDTDILTDDILDWLMTKC